MLENRFDLELMAPAGETVRSWADLERMGYIDHPDGQAMATRLLSRCFPGKPGARNLPCHGLSNQISLILEPVARGLGFSALPRYARLAFSRPESIQVIEAEAAAPVVDTLWLLHRAEWPLTTRAERMLQHNRLHFASAGRRS